MTNRLIEVLCMTLGRPLLYLNWNFFELMIHFQNTACFFISSVMELGHSLCVV